MEVITRCRDTRLGEVVDFGVRPAVDDLLGGGRTDERKLFELVGGCLIQVDGGCRGCLLLGSGLFLWRGLRLDGDTGQKDGGAQSEERLRIL